MATIAAVYVIEQWLGERPIAPRVAMFAFAALLGYALLIPGSPPRVAWDGMTPFLQIPKLYWREGANVYKVPSRCDKKRYRMVAKLDQAQFETWIETT